MAHPMTRAETAAMEVDVLIANLVNASRAAGFARGRRVDDTEANLAEDAALGALKPALVAFGREAESTAWERGRDDVVLYLREVLARNHPMIADTFNHAAHNASSLTREICDRMRALHFPSLPPGAPHG